MSSFNIRAGGYEYRHENVEEKFEFEFVTGSDVETVSMDQMVSLFRDTLSGECRHEGLFGVFFVDSPFFTTLERVKVDFDLSNENLLVLEGAGEEELTWEIDI